MTTWIYKSNLGGVAEVQVGGRVGSLDTADADVSGKTEEAGAVQVNFDGSIRKLGAEEVNTYVPGNFQTTWGSPVSAKQALEDPANHTIEIGGYRTTVEAAIKARLIDAETGRDIPQEAPVQKPVQRVEFMDADVKQYINALRARTPNFDAAFNRVLANSGKDVADEKTNAAISAYASQVGHDDVEQARNSVNAVIRNVLERAAVTLAVKTNPTTAEAAMDYLLNTVDHHNRTSLFRGLMNGDARTLDKILEFYTLKNR